MHRSSSPTNTQIQQMIENLRVRFVAHTERHQDISWDTVLRRLQSRSSALHSLWYMESTGGEPDVVGYDHDTGTIVFMDCASETPLGRRSACYDRKAQESRKQNAPEHNVMDLVTDMGVTLLDEEQYRELQKLGPFDTKTSSWLLTPSEIREKGGALFGDHRYGRTFIYHNGAQSWYSSRGFRARLLV